MLKIKILSVGKTKETWLNTAIEEYQKRLQGQVEMEWVWAKDDPQLMALVSREPLVVCLDPQGKMLSSEQFSSFLMRKLEEGGSRLTFVIGGAEGLPLFLKQNKEAISLSLLTFTHQIARVVLIEQIYRALEIAKGSRYHK
ncbi:23S rRNA (pseudouridine(1915)-N(3))-methyltransferase RlmH [Parachlamydia sp. AcF125]|uniref:23S rRNA (pseudouridine(1915)-N(3))-methyltransferase RlmH n=1 Tax=Parachlamydia sp. AcF125 TaxID=2795736 RepID=UPI001BC8D685|nr:23S rRNA (pseudouridine(1915)-N(3))-methyltransferase RlmH [Parachlamydia sp. AcF125]MBS4168886.1 Ribosomal RNA large subunit methyltransferase H [Parachlamydia sp. AcF125]